MTLSLDDLLDDLADRSIEQTRPWNPPAVAAAFGEGAYVLAGATPAPAWYSSSWATAARHCAVSLPSAIVLASKITRVPSGRLPGRSMAAGSFIACVQKSLPCVILSRVNRDASPTTGDARQPRCSLEACCWDSFVGGVRRGGEGPDRRRADSL